MSLRRLAASVLPLALSSSLAAASNPAWADRSVDQHGHRLQAMVRAQPAPNSDDVGRSFRGNATTSWRALGPDGGEVTAVELSPTAEGVALAATFTGIYRSTDGGESWQLIPETDGLWTTDVVFGPDGTAYAGTFDNVWTSTDDGTSWDRLDMGLSAWVIHISIDPSNPNNLWAGLSSSNAPQPIFVMRSTDAGASWSPASPTLPINFSCGGIAIHPNDSNQVVAVCGGFAGGGGIFFSTDGGANWINRSAGLPNSPLNAVVHQGSRVLIGGGQRFGGNIAGLFASNDSGVTWQPLHDASWPLLVVNALALDPADPSILLAGTDGTGLHRSTDGGDTWQLSIPGTTDLAILSVRFADDVILLGTSSKGVFRGTTGGDPFEPSTRGINVLIVNSIVANPVNGRELAAAFEGQNDGGVYTSTNGGLTWTLEPLPPTRYRTVRFAPNGTLYAISTGPSNIAPEGLYRREANGTWTSLGPDQGGFYETDLDALRFSNNDPDLILTGGQDFGVAGFEPTIWRTTDAGQNWTKAYEGFGLTSTVSDLEIVEDGTDTDMLASYFFGEVGGVLRSTDSGSSWTLSNTGLPGGPNTFHGSSLCAPVGSTDTFYLADRADARLWSSTDRGQSWQPTGFTNSLLEEVVCDPEIASILYVAQIFSNTQVLRSEDSGASFIAFDPGLDGAIAVRSLDVVTDPVTQLLLGTDRGAYARYLNPGVVFADGFEAGNTSAWTETVP